MKKILLILVFILMFKLYSKFQYNMGLEEGCVRAVFYYTGGDEYKECWSDTLWELLNKK